MKNFKNLMLSFRILSSQILIYHQKFNNKHLWLKRTE